MKLDRRSFLKLCGTTVGGGVLGVGKAAADVPAPADTWHMPGLQLGEITFTTWMTPPEWKAMEALCAPMYFVGYDGMYKYSNEEGRQ